MEDRELLREQWRRVSQALGIAFVAPFSIEPGLEFACLLPEFGSPKGMLIDARHNEIAFKIAIERGYGCSSMLPEAQLVVQPDDYVGCLQDWGWSIANRPPPSWYSGAG